MFRLKLHPLEAGNTSGIGGAQDACAVASENGKGEYLPEVLPEINPSQNLPKDPKPQRRVHPTRAPSNLSDKRLTRIANSSLGK